MDTSEVKKLDENLIELKKEYDRIRAQDYRKALEFWEEKIIPLFSNHPIPLLSNNLALNIALDSRPIPKTKREAAISSFFPPELEGDILSALPQQGNENELEIFNLWYLKIYTNQSADIEKAKQVIHDILSNSPDGNTFLLKEKNDLERELNALDEKITERFRDIERERKKRIKELIIRGQQPDWKSVSDKTAKDYADIKLKIELLVYVKELIENWNSQRPSKKKMKWNASPSMLGFLITELAKKGYIEYPLRAGEINFSGLANIAFEIFEVETTIQNLQKEFNPNKNTFSDTKQSKFVIPELKDLK